ncbi:MAG: aldehyde dehydrogenase [Lachnospiraceae bacterium]|nr:aldehyde dehydrogenase [Lachnospiraceae bacterium]
MTENRENQIKELVNNQRRFFEKGDTTSVDYRIRALKKLKESIVRYEHDINEALKMDLGKSAHESYMCETGLVLSEITHMLKHIRKYSRKKTVRSPLVQFHSKSFYLPSPYGVVLVMSPWNYPFFLTMGPVIDAMAAGNTIILKPSNYSPYTSEIIKKIVSECFDEQYMAVVTGGRSENTCLLEQKFDYIFFTGSKEVGKEVMKRASLNLTPVTLELGGKSPCIVEKSADIKLAAKRIVFGKFLNCGQTCVAPDYVYCDETIKDRLVSELKKQLVKQYGEQPLEGRDYGKIVNNKHFHRLLGLINKEKVVVGGGYNESTLQIEPTILDNVTFEDEVMQEEIFGPLLPVVVFESTDEAIGKINSMEHPLAMYIFTGNKKIADKFIRHCGFGGGCVNDVVIHLATTEMGFGGFGESGMGAYHGKTGFDTFSHYKSIVDKKTWIDMPLRYQPYVKFYDKVIHFFLK